jgi:predicted nuclease with TOPRIM domain
VGHPENMDLHKKIDDIAEGIDALAETIANKIKKKTDIEGSIDEILQNKDKIKKLGLQMMVMCKMLEWYRKLKKRFIDS